MFVRTQPGRTQEALASLQEIASQFNPAHPFEYHFLDERFRQTYHGEMVVGKLAGYFTAFALFIACLGLFGLVAYAAERRTKEIGIRKVVGASIGNIVSLLSKDFLKLVLIGFLMAIPFTWYVMHQWLQHFAYRIEISGFTFLIAGLVALLIALATVSFQSIKAARVNPVDSLRNSKQKQLHHHTQTRIRMEPLPPSNFSFYPWQCYCLRVFLVNLFPTDTTTMSASTWM